MAKKVAKSATVKASKSKSAAKSAKKREVEIVLNRVAKRLDNGKPLAMPSNGKLGAYGGRGARTIAIENAIKTAGAKGLTMSEINSKSNTLAAAMHVRNLCASDGRPHFNGKAPVGRRICPTTGKFIYVDVASVKGKGLLPSYRVNGKGK